MRKDPRIQTAVINGNSQSILCLGVFFPTLKKKKKKFFLINTITTDTQN